MEKRRQIKQETNDLLQPSETDNYENDLPFGKSFRNELNNLNGMENMGTWSAEQSFCQDDKFFRGEILEKTNLKIPNADNEKTGLENSWIADSGKNNENTIEIEEIKEERQTSPVRDESGYELEAQIEVKQEPLELLDGEVLQEAEEVGNCSILGKRKLEDQESDKIDKREEIPSMVNCFFFPEIKPENFSP